MIGLDSLTTNERRTLRDVLTKKISSKLTPEEIDVVNKAIMGLM